MPDNSERAVDSAPRAPVPLAGRAKAPDSLNLTTDRRESFQVWGECWEDYTLLVGLQEAAQKIQLAALKN